MRTALTVPHLLLAVAVMAVWGSNFVVVKLALAHLPPLLFAALRFSCVFLPAAVFVRRPDATWRNLAAYGLLIGVGQFGAMFLALKADVTPGLASLIMQTQVFFTIGLSMWLTGERVRAVQVAALMLAIGGIGVILMHTGGNISWAGFGLLMIAALGWAGGNMASRAAGPVDMLGYVVWSSLFAVPPLLILALFFEGWSAIVIGVRSADALTWLAVGWQAVGNAMFGYGVWGWLLARYPAATVAPMALMIPVFGMGASAFFLGEPLQPWKLAAAALVLSGLALGVLWSRLATRDMAEPV